MKDTGAETFHSRKNGESRPNGLTDWLDFHGMLPAPTASCKYAGSPKDRQDGKTRDSELNHRVAKAFGATSQLNPLFVAEMMGFPREWLTLPFLGRNGGRNP